MDADGLALAAEYMPIFPLIGALIGLIGGAFTWILEFYFSSLFASALGLGSLLLLNGAQHIDGLLDFGDGVMCHGSRAMKLKVMRDPQTGAGGFTIGWIILSSTVFAIANVNRNIVIPSLIASEAAATFSMVLEAWAGTPAHRGMSSGFITAMHSKPRNLRLAASALLLLLIGTLTMNILGVAVTGVGVIVALIVLMVSDRAFGGVTGDVMGATHELTRLLSLAVIVMWAR